MTEVEKAKEMGFNWAMQGKSETPFQDEKLTALISKRKTAMSKLIDAWKQGYKNLTK